MIRDMDMPTGSSGPVTNLGRESSLKVAVAPLTRSKSQINNLNFIYLGSAVHHDHEVSLTIVDNFVVIGRFHEFELTKPSNTKNDHFSMILYLDAEAGLSSFCFIIAGDG